MSVWFRSGWSVMTRDPSPAGAREARAPVGWTASFDRLAAVDAKAPLEGVDLEAMAEAAYLAGRDDEAVAAWLRAHQWWLAAGHGSRAARPAFWLSLALVLRGDEAQSGGWLARGQRLVEEAGGDCVEAGYVLFMAGMWHFDEGDLEAAVVELGQAADIGRRFADADVLAMARMGSAQTRLWLGQTAEGLTLLDEAMVAVTAGEVSPIAAGLVYCAVIEACHDIFDLRRAGEWTQALTLWCASQPDLVPYRGNCQVHRAEMLLLRGRWDDAQIEAEQAQQRLEGAPSGGNAHYQRGEVHRLRGQAAEAEQAFREASDLGKVPQPGLALLRLAQGRPQAASASIQRLLGETKERVMRARLLGAAVEILLAADDIGAARAAADELSGHAAKFDAPLLYAAAWYAAGAVLLAEDNPSGACETLRRAADAWRALKVPYELARTQFLLGMACSQLGDSDSAALELDGARRSFIALGALPALRHLDRLAGADRPQPGGPGGLTAREMEVLAILASGRTNRAIAADLVISEKTVARHVANIFTKLGLSSRSGATAYAYEHGLV